MPFCLHMPGAGIWRLTHSAAVPTGTAKFAELGGGRATCRVTTVPNGVDPRLPSHVMGVRGHAGRLKVLRDSRVGGPYESVYRQANLAFAGSRSNLGTKQKPSEHGTGCPPHGN